MQNEIYEDIFNNFEEIEIKEIASSIPDELIVSKPPVLIPKRISDLPGADEPISFLVDGWIEEKSLNSIIAPSKAGKSILSLQLAASVQNGLEFLHTFKCNKADVLYVDFELKPNVIKQRFESLKSYLGIELEEPYYLSLANDYAHGVVDFYNVIDSVNAAIAKNPNIKLVIFDCFYTWVMGDPNSEIDARRSLMPLKGLSEDLAIVYVHHTNKAGIDLGNVGNAGSGSSVHFRIVDSSCVIIPDQKAKETQKMFELAFMGRNCPDVNIRCKRGDETNHQFVPVSFVPNASEKFDEISKYIADGHIGRGNLAFIRKDFSVTVDELRGIGFDVDTKHSQVTIPDVS